MKHYVRLTITDLRKTHAKCHPRERENNDDNPPLERRPVETIGECLDDGNDNA